MKKSENKYIIKQNLDKIYSGKPTLFLNLSLVNKIISELKKKNVSYNIYETFSDCDYKIIYTKIKPKVMCLKIISNNPLRHQAIMGSLYSLNISEGYFGDIIVGDEQYIFVLKSMYEYIKENLNFISSEVIKLEVASLTNYEKEYLEHNILVSNLRLDIVISKICNISRSKAKNIILNNDVLVNYKIVTDISYNLKENDVFSIRKVGKFKFDKILNQTKNKKMLILIKKYV